MYDLVVNNNFRVFIHEGALPATGTIATLAVRHRDGQAQLLVAYKHISQGTVLFDRKHDPRVSDEMIEFIPKTVD